MASINTLNATVTAQSTQIATNTADIATNTAGIATNAANINALGVTTAAAFGGGSTYTSGGGVSAPAYRVQARNYNNVGSAITALDDGLSAVQSQISGMQTQNNLLAAGYLGHGQDIAALRNSVQRGYEGSAIAAATAAGNYLPENKKFAIVGKLSQFRGQYGLGMQGQMRLNDNIVGIASIGGGVRYGGVMTAGGIAVAW